METQLNEHNCSHGTTKVIFRKWKTNGDIIALFPEVPADNIGNLCSSYEHIGQHGGADYNLVVFYKTKPATPEEYADLKKELETLGYCLEVRQRATTRDYLNRRNAAKIINP